MTLSIYDILNKNIDYRKEYKKIKNMFLNEYLLVGQTHDYKYNEVFDAYIMKWKYRGTKCSLEEIIEDIEREIKCGLDPINDCLHLCELILNVREFITYISKKYYLYDMNINIFSDELLIGTIEYLAQIENIELEYDKPYVISGTSYNNRRRRPCAARRSRGSAAPPGSGRRRSRPCRCRPRCESRGCRFLWTGPPRPKRRCGGCFR